MGAATPQTAISVDSLATPALVVHADIVRRNIRRVAEYASRHHLALRPHAKTHKSRMISRLQLAAGAIGLTVAKVGEAAQLMTETSDLLLAYPVVDRARATGLAEIASTKTVRAAVDSVLAIETLSAAAGAANVTIGLLVDLDVGMGRTGVSTAEETLKLAQLISNTANVRLDGILCYPGHVWSPVAQQGPPLEKINQKLIEVINLWKQNGLEAKMVSGGSTPTLFQSHAITPYTEIRCGTYVFNDMNTFRGGYCALEDCAARMVCTVVSTAAKNQVVIDGGTKTFTSDICIPARDSGNGYVLEYPEAKITALSEEHGQVDVSRCEKQPKLGERITVIPNHICPCVNLREEVWWLEEDGTLQTTTIDARGKLT
jgi:D-serine deaminase-like pyridoxal phosphate-dependent protein